MSATKLILAIVSGGALLGTALGNMAYPEMKFRPGEDWRARHASDYSATSMQFVDAGPEDLDPTWHGPVYEGPNYVPAVYASDQDWEFEYLMQDSYLAEEDYPSSHAYSPSYDDVPADFPPSDLAPAELAADQRAVPLAVERASEEAAKVAAELSARPQANPSALPNEVGPASPASNRITLSVR